jgi:hypothetical protein
MEKKLKSILQKLLYNLLNYINETAIFTDVTKKKHTNSHILNIIKTAILNGSNYQMKINLKNTKNKKKYDNH